MQFISTKSELLSAISIVGRAASKMQKTILECILFTCEKERIVLHATDIALSIKAQCNAQIMEEGRAALPARVLIEIINHMPDSDITVKSVGDNSIEISCLNSKAVLQKMDAAEFPMFPTMEKQEKLKMQQNVLREMINQTIFSVATAEDKPILTGMYFDIQKNHITLVALDGYRMAIRSQEAISDIETSCVIPSRTLRELSRILEDSEEPVKLSIGTNMALFEVGTTEIYTRLLDGEYIQYKKLINSDFLTSITVESAMLRDSLERASILAREMNNVVRMDITEKNLEISSNSEMGNIDENIAILSEGKDLTIAFNAKYILDVLKNVEETEVTIQFKTSTSPCIIKKEGKYCYFILPVQLRE